MTNIHVRFPAPHSEIQRQIFLSLSTKGLLETWVSCGTKFGKTISGSVAEGKAVISRKQGIFRWVAPTYQQSLIGHRNITRLLPPDPWVTYTESIIKVPDLKSMIEFKSGDKPENLEGEACHGYVLDECAKMRAEVYSSAKTTVTMTRGPMLMISTPRGKNWFYQKCMEAKAEMEWCIANERTITKIFLTAPSAANSRIKQAALDDMRRSIPERLYRQYVEALFIDDGSTFLGFRDCYYTDPIDLHTEHQVWYSGTQKQSSVVIGVDWAKTIDFTVFIAVDIVTRRVVAFERFHKRAYTQAIRQLVKFSLQFAETVAVFHDKTGVGQAIEDQLAYTELPYTGITFTNQSKVDMVNGLITAVETKGIGLVQWNVLDSELDAYEVTTNELGTMKYGAPPGKHDDAVSALMLANAALEQYADRDYTIKYLDNLKSDTKVEKSEIEKYYTELDDEDDF